MIINSFYRNSLNCVAAFAVVAGLNVQTAGAQGALEGFLDEQQMLRLLDEQGNLLGGVVRPQFESGAILEGGVVLPQLNTVNPNPTVPVVSDGTIPADGNTPGVGLPPVQTNPTIVTTTPTPTPVVPTPTPTTLGIFNPNIPPESQIQVRVQFARDSAQILPEATPQLNVLCTALSQRPTLRLNIFGHTDSSGSDAYNLALSQRRAGSVKSYLVNNCGIADQRLYPVGLGEQMLLNGLVPTSPVHRRVEFQVVI